jgi:3-phenylpropionate/trans-cinnamate dioxygenase ferredoxin subunit
MTDFVKVASVSDLTDGEIMMIEVDGDSVLLANLEGKFYAIGEECSHAAGSLSEGYVENGQVECPVHGSLFDLKTGVNASPPAAEPVQAYPVRIEGEDVLVGPAEG